MIQEKLIERLQSWRKDALEAGSDDLADLLEEVADALAEQQGRVAEAERDAERYRWLREHFRFANDSQQEIWFDASIKRPTLGPPYPPGIRGESIAPELDAAIDAARERGKGEGES